MICKGEDSVRVLPSTVVSKEINELQGDGVPRCLLRKRNVGFTPCTPYVAFQCSFLFQVGKQGS